MRKRIKEMLERGADSGEIFKDLTTYPQLETRDSKGKITYYSAQDLTHLTIQDEEGNEIERRPLQGKEFFFMQKLVKVMFERFLTSGILMSEKKTDMPHLQGEFGPHYEKIEELESQMAMAEQYLTRIGIKEFRNNKRLGFIDRLFLLVDKIDVTVKEMNKPTEEMHLFLDKEGIGRYDQGNKELSVTERMQLMKDALSSHPTAETPEGHAMKEVECVHKCLDEWQTPVARSNGHGKVFSLWGRVEEFGRLRHHEGLGDAKVALSVEDILAMPTTSDGSYITLREVFQQALKGNYVDEPEKTAAVLIKALQYKGVNIA